MEDYKRKAFVTFRHFRRPSGSVTACCHVIHRGNAKDMTIGLAFCSPEDNFSRPKGREESLKRFIKNPIVFTNIDGIAKTIMEFLKTATWDQIGVLVYRPKGLGHFDEWFHKFLAEL